MASYLHKTYGQKLYTITNAQRKSYKNPIRLSTSARLTHYWPLLYFCLLNTTLTIAEKVQEHVGGLPHIGALLYLIKLQCSCLKAYGT